jgi:serine/alanine adding enzyme
MNKDIYFTKKYAILNELIEDGAAEFFEVKTSHGHITDSFIKRKIEMKVNDTTYYDIISGYGYGGPIVHEASNLDALINDYKTAASEYCQEHNIVSSFVRFHPVFGNQEPFKSVFEVSYLRDTVGTTLNKYEDTFQSEFSSTARNKVRKRLKNENLSSHINMGFVGIGEFINIYQSTMNRHHADRFYYFKDEYFYRMKELFQKDIMTISIKYGKETIAMGLYLLSGNIIHDHLNGTKVPYLKYSPAYLLKYAALRWGEKNGYKLIHYGGGVTNDCGDSVLGFKKRFSRHTTFQYYTGKKIWNNAIYQKLLAQVGTHVDEESDFFPAYRRIETGHIMKS